MKIQANQSYKVRTHDVLVKALNPTTRSQKGPCWEVLVLDGPEAGITTAIAACDLTTED